MELSEMWILYYFCSLYCSSLKNRRIDYGLYDDSLYDDDFSKDSDLLSLLSMYFKYIQALTQDDFELFCNVIREKKFKITLFYGNDHMFKWDWDIYSNLYFPSLLYFRRMRNIGLTEDDFVFLLLLYNGTLQDILTSERKMFDIKKYMDRQLAFDINFVWRIRLFLRLVRSSRIKLVEHFYFPVRLMKGSFIGCLSTPPNLEMFIFGTLGNEKISKNFRDYFNSHYKAVSHCGLLLEKERVSDFMFATLKVVSDISMFTQEEIQDDKVITKYLDGLEYNVAYEAIFLSQKLGYKNFIAEIFNGKSFIDKSHLKYGGSPVEQKMEDFRSFHL